MSKLLKPRTKRHIEELGNFVIQGRGISIPNTIESNIHEYKRLVQNVFKDNLKSAFPLTNNLLSDLEWEKLTEYFIKNHKCKSHQIWKMPFEFFQFYSEKENFLLLQKYPFLIELLYIEWLEIEVYMMENEVFPKYSSSGDFKNNYLVVNPELRIVGLSYPIHLKKANEIQVTDKDQYFLSIHRHPEDLKVIFTDLSLVFAEVIIYIYEQEEPTLEDLIELLLSKKIGREIAEPALNSFINEAIKSKLILGFNK